MPTTRHVQLDDSIVQTGANPGTDGVESQALDAGRFGLELGQHDGGLRRTTTRR